MPFTKQHSAYAWVVTCILFLINLTFHNLPLHSSYKIHQPITDYFLRLPYSELLETHLFRSRANRRLVSTYLRFNHVVRVPVSLWGSGGWGCVRSTLRLCSQPSATVPWRPCEARMAVPMVSSAKGVTFGGCTCRVASFRVTGVALRDIQTCFVTCRKSFCVAGAILLRCFRKMRCSFCVRRSALDASIVILRGRRSTLDASCCVFLANRILRAMSSGNKVQFPW